MSGSGSLFSEIRTACISLPYSNTAPFVIKTGNPFAYGVLVCIRKLNPHIKGKKNQEPESQPEGCNEHRNLHPSFPITVFPLLETYLKLYGEDVRLTVSIVPEMQKSALYRKYEQTVGALGLRNKLIGFLSPRLPLMFFMNAVYFLHFLLFDLFCIHRNRDIKKKYALQIVAIYK